MMDICLEGSRDRKVDAMELIRDPVNMTLKIQSSSTSLAVMVEQCPGHIGQCLYFSCWVTG